MGGSMRRRGKEWDSVGFEANPLLFVNDSLLEDWFASLEPHNLPFFSSFYWLFLLMVSVIIIVSICLLSHFSPWISYLNITNNKNYRDIWRNCIFVRGWWKVSCGVDPLPLHIHKERVDSDPIITPPFTISSNHFSSPYSCFSNYHLNSAFFSIEFYFYK